MGWANEAKVEIMSMLQMKRSVKFFVLKDEYLHICLVVTFKFLLQTVLVTVTTIICFPGLVGQNPN
jgi:hypothetical protein